jgi:hypothetical protein
MSAGVDADAIPAFARILARQLLIELAVAAPPEPGELVDALGVCWLCRAELQAHERPERICDACLRTHQMRPRAA